MKRNYYLPLPEIGHKMKRAKEEPLNDYVHSNYVPNFYYPPLTGLPLRYYVFCFFV